MTKHVNSVSFAQAGKFCLAFLLFLSVNIVSVKASSIIEIYTINDLYDIEQCYTCDYVLMSDLDFNNEVAQENSKNYNEETGWRVIGKATNSYFTGSLDGNGFVFKNLRMQVNEHYVGLIYQSNRALFQNITFENVHIEGNDNVGALIAKNAFNTSILNVSVSGTIQGKTYVGSILGLGAQTTLNQIYSSATVIGERSVGGIVGALTEKGTLSNIHSQAHVQGLICGDNNTSSTCSVGGVVGSVTSGAGSIEQVFFNGQLTHGKNEAFNNVYTKYIHPLIGSDQKGLENVGVYYYRDNPYLIENSLTDEQLPLMSSYETFDFDTIWSIEEYAYLKNNTYFNKVIEEVGIKISEYPHKLEYEYDQEIDLEGLVVHVEYNDESSSEIDHTQYTTSVDRENQVVTISYLEYEVSFAVIILPREQYTIKIIKTGVGGSIQLTVNENVVESNQLLDKGSVVDVHMLLHPFGRIKSLSVNDTIFDDTSFKLKEDTQIEVEFMLLGDLNDDKELTKDDLKHYISLLSTSHHSVTSDTNEDDQTTIADYVYLENFLNDMIDEPTVDFEVKSIIDFDLHEVTKLGQEIVVKLSVHHSNVGAIFLKVNTNQHEIMDISVENHDAQLELDANSGSLILSGLDNKNNNQSHHLVVSINCKESCDEEILLSLEQIQYSDTLGINTFKLENFEFMVNIEEILKEEVIEEEFDQEKPMDDDVDEENKVDSDEKDKIKDTINQEDSIIDSSNDGLLQIETPVQKEEQTRIPNMSQTSNGVLRLLLIGVCMLWISKKEKIKKKM